MPPFKLHWSELSERWSAVERWLLPGECLLCQRSGISPGHDPLICAPCQSRWAPLPEPQCDRCGQPRVPGIACRVCEQWEPGIAQLRSAVWLDAGARRAVHLLKYGGWRRLAEPLAACMQRRLGVSRESTLIPIPLGPARLRSRGYNQSAELARALGKRLGVPVAEDLLRRARDTATQTALTPEARRANLAGAFVARAAPERPVLVDDVFTTGATLVQAARALLDAGAVLVTGLTFARAMRPLAAVVAEAESTSWSGP